MTFFKISFTGTTRNLIWTSVFALAMGFLEAIVVVYLRRIYYPDGFNFPLALLSPGAIATEWLREAATIVMLLAVGILTGKNNLQRLLWFLFCFAVWDLFYYLGLKLLLDWPASLLTWDILFLIPVTWIGPVLAPVICSLTMIMMSVPLIILIDKGVPVSIKPVEWTLIFSGAILIFITFVADYTSLIIQNSGFSLSGSPEATPQLEKAIAGFIPGHYNWLLFAAGEILILVALFMLFLRLRKNATD